MNKSVKLNFREFYRRIRTRCLWAAAHDLNNYCWPSSQVFLSSFIFNFEFMRIFKSFWKKFENQARVGSARKLEFEQKIFENPQLKLCGKNFTFPRWSWWKLERRLKRSRGIEIRMRTSVFRTSSIADNHYNEEVRWNVDKLKREVTWMRKVGRNWRINGGTNERKSFDWFCQNCILRAQGNI